MWHKLPFYPKTCLEFSFLLRQDLLQGKGLPALQKEVALSHLSKMHLIFFVLAHLQHLQTLKFPAEALFLNAKLQKYLNTLVLAGKTLMYLCHALGQSLEYVAP